MRTVRKLALLVTAVAIATVCAAVPTSAEPTIPVYVFAGQSNMVGTATMTAALPGVDAKLQVPPANVLFWGPTTDAPRIWGPLEAPTEVMQSMFRSGFGPEVSAAHALTRLRPGRRIAVLKLAWNATSLYRDWNPKRSRSLYRHFVARADYALHKLRKQTGARPVVRGLFWMQGESDAKTKVSALKYGRNLKTLISSVRRDFDNARMPVVLGRIRDVRRIHSWLRYSHIVRAQQTSVARSVPRVWMVSTDQLATEPLSPLHFNTKGTVGLGRLFIDRRFGI